MHLCERSGSISRLACCHFVRILNDSQTVPLCDELFMNETRRAALQVQPHSTPVYLSFPAEVPEDHLTFCFGILLLISVAVFCAVVIMKLTKPKVGFARLPSGFSLSGSMDYDIMMWLPRQQRRNSMLLFLRSVRSLPPPDSTLLSLGLLPSYRSAASSSVMSPSSLPPPPYEELESLTCSRPSTRSSYLSHGPPS